MYFVTHFPLCIYSFRSTTLFFCTNIAICEYNVFDELIQVICKMHFCCLSLHCGAIQLPQHMIPFLISEHRCVCFSFLSLSTNIFQYFVYEYPLLGQQNSASDLLCNGRIFRANFESHCRLVIRVLE